MPINEELIIDVADRIRDILDDYPAGPAILREILQNTDDAGGTVQIAAYTLWKAFSTLSSKIVRGRPLLLTTTHRSNLKTGPQFEASLILRRKEMRGVLGSLVLDFAHATMSAASSTPLDDHGLTRTAIAGPASDRATYPAHFEAFKGIQGFGADTFDGTAIRLPLRQPNSNSRISSTSMSVQAARELFDSFIKDDLPEVMLFLKHITSIELYELSPDGTKTDLAIIQIKNADEVKAERSKNRGRSSRAEMNHYELKISMTSNPGSMNSKTYTRRWIITHYVDSFGIAVTAMVKRLDPGENPEGIKARMISDKLFPHVALAFPVPDAIASPKHIFS
ncbi:hypothetical protein FRC00_002978, partial [Tulasnella sp. 408]